MNNLFKKTEKTLYDFKNLDLKIENIELHINRLGYMVKNTTIDGFQLGADGAWVVTTPTVSTTTISNNTISNKKSVGFDELSLSSDTEGYVRPVRLSKVM